MNIDSERAAREVIKRLLPDEYRRRVLLENFAEAIREANRYGRDNWAVHLLQDEVRLHAGHHIVFTINEAHGGSGWMALGAEATGEEERALLTSTTSWIPDETEYPEYKIVSSHNGYYCPSRDDGDIWPCLRHLHFDFIYKATHARPIDPRTPTNHSAGMLKYLRNTLRRLVPDPLHKKE